MKLPLLEEEVRGVDALRAFSTYLVHPYQYTAPTEGPSGGAAAGGSEREAALAAEMAKLKARVAELEAQLAAK